MSEKNTPNPAALPVSGPASKHQVASYFGVTVRTVERWANDGRIPAPTVVGPRLKRFDAEGIRNHFHNSMAA